MSRFLSSLPLLLMAGACGSADGGADAASAADASPPFTTPEEPAPPDPPSFDPCPDGTADTLVDDAVGVSACLPPDVPETPCGPGEGLFPGAWACAPVGDACPAGEWPADLPADAEVRYVRPAAVGGDGSLAAPFGRVSEALAAAGTGATVALSTGRHGGPFVASRPVSVLGACAALTSVTGSATVTAEGVSLAQLGLRESNVALTVRPGAAASLRAVVTESVSTLGWNIDGGSLTAERVVIRDVTPRPSDGLFGRGINAESGAVVMADEISVRRTHGVAVAAIGDGTQIFLERAVVSDTDEDADRTGRALSANQGARIEVRRGLFERNIETDAVADRGSLVLEDLVVRGARPRSDGTLGMGAVAQAGSTLDLRRVTLLATRRAAVQLSSIDTEARFEDLLIADCLPEEATGMFGRAMVVALGSQAILSRVHVARCLETAILVADTSTRAELRDVRIRNTGQVEGLARGLVVGLGASALVERVTVEGSEEVGVIVTEGALEGSDLVIRDTVGTAAEGLLGHGLHVAPGTATLTRVLSERNRAAGVLVGLPGTEVRLVDLRVADTGERACATDTCADAGGGIALSVLESAHVDLERFALVDGALCGLQLARGGEADARDGRVAGNPVGANVQSPDFDIGRITERVFYDNDRNLDATVLAVPELDTGM